MKKQNRVLIIGGGASGLFAAITAAEHGALVTVLEREKKAGRKILKTGNGKCNFTNIGNPAHAYHGTDRVFAKKVLTGFTPQDTIKRFTEYGIFTTNRNDWIYPRSETAESVLTTLMWRASELHVKVKCNEEVRKIEKKDNVFIVRTGTWHYEADKVILACGSAASLTDKQLPYKSYELAVMMGHSVVNPLPALVPLKVRNSNSLRWGGVRIGARVSLYAEDIYIADEEGQIQLTDSGISGIPVFAISGQALRLLEGGLRVAAVLDFLPEFSTEGLAGFLYSRKKMHPERGMGDLLVGLLPERLIFSITDRVKSEIERAVLSEDIDDDHGNDQTGITDRNEIRILAEVIKEFKTEITGSAGFANAQCVTGGISTDEVDPSSCESKKTGGLYLTGEMLDIDGACGGWNLQFAWSTGYLAGMHAAEAL